MGQKEKQIFQISVRCWYGTYMPLDLRSWQTANNATKNGKACKSLSITEDLNLRVCPQEDQADVTHATSSISLKKGQYHDRSSKFLRKLC